MRNVFNPELRHGVTPTEHAVLDLITQYQADWAENYSPEELAEIASSDASCAVKLARLEAKRGMALLGAARLIAAAEGLSKQIAEGAGR